MHDFDDEQTLAEEEEMAIAGGEDPQNELNSLQKVSCVLLLVVLLVFVLMFWNFNLQESDMPLEELLALYGYNGKGGRDDKGRGDGDDTENNDEDDGEEDEDEYVPVEQMEEDGEEENDDEESLESTSSCSMATAATNKKILVSEEIQSDTEPKVKIGATTKSHSDLHLLYTSEEGNIPETRLLRSSGATGTVISDEDVDEEDDVDYAPGEDEWRKVSHNPRISEESLTMTDFYFIANRQS